jgi:putative restriction endonuclease
MIGLISPTDYDWYSFLHQHEGIEEVNFWRPSAGRRVLAEPFTPFFFKLKAPHNAICGFGFLVKYSALPVWLAWESFGIGNGCASRREMLDRIHTIRTRMKYRESGHGDLIGCLLMTGPVFFDRDDWIPQPSNWPPRNLTPMRYDLTTGEGRRIWEGCQERAQRRRVQDRVWPAAAETSTGYGEPVLIRPRMGQGSFRISVTDAYERACSVTNEHSLPALEAAHIRPYSESGPHDIANGLLLRADFHRLFDQGYLTVTPDLHFEVSPKLREDFENGHSYYPFHGRKLRLPSAPSQAPSRAFIEWHNDNVYRA